MNDPSLLHELLGPYALGQLSSSDAASFEEHLATCADCAADLAFVSPAAAALGDLRGVAPMTSSSAPADLGDRVVHAVSSEARADSRARFLRIAGVSAVAAAVAAIALVAGFRLTQPAPAVVAPKIPLETVRVVDNDASVKATATVVPHTWGMEVKLHASGFNVGQRYLVTVLGTDGAEHDAGEFVGTGATEMDCNLSSSVLRDQAAGFEVRDTAGSVLVTSTF